MSDEDNVILFPRRPRRHSPKLTPEIAGKIKYLIGQDGMQHDVAALFKINQGGVSEVINGHRFPDVPPMPMTI